MPARRGKANLVVFLSARVEDLRRLIPRALRSSEQEAVHFARVATRRLKSAIDLLQTVLPEETRNDFSDALRRLRRALGPMRDVDVMSSHLDAYRRKERYKTAASWLTKILQSKRGPLHRKAVRKAPVQQILKSLGAWWAIEQELNEAQQAQAALIRRVVPRQLESFIRRADRLTRVRLQEHAQVHEDVHALRIDGKLLRYTLELAIPIGFLVPATLLRSFKRLQDALGLWHDYVVLGETCLRTALDQQLSLHDPHLYGQILTLADRCRRDSNAQLNRFARLWAKGGASIHSAIISSLKAEAPAISGGSKGTPSERSNPPLSRQSAKVINS